MKKPPLGTLALWLTLAPSAARADESDVGLWLEAGASYDLGERVEVTGTQHLRFDRDVSRVSSVTPHADLSFEAWEFLELGAGYRLEYERDIDDLNFERKHRLQASAEIGTDLRRITPSYRVRIQDHVEDAFASPTLKHRLEIEWKRRGRWRPAASGELYYDVESRELNRLRTTLGVEIETKDVDMEVFYRVDLPKNAMDPVRHIMGLGMGFEL